MKWTNTKNYLKMPGKITVWPYVMSFQLLGLRNVLHVNKTYSSICQNIYRPIQKERCITAKINKNIYENVHRDHMFVGRFNITKMSILFSWIQRGNIIQIKILKS